MEGIKKIPDITQALAMCRNGDRYPHTVFELFPRNDNRIWIQRRIQPTSQYALHLLLRAQVFESNLSISTIYHDLKVNEDAAEIVGRIWERAVHAYLQNLPTKTTLTLKALGDYADRILVVDPTMRFRCCGSDADFQNALSSSLESFASCYLFPLSKIFPTVDSVALTFNRGRQFDIFQMSTAGGHPIRVSGLQAVQSWLKRDTVLNKLRPTTASPFAISFVLPKRLSNSFRRQRLIAAKKESSMTPSKHRRTEAGSALIADEDHLATFWEDKIRQYVLALDEDEVLLAYTRLFNPHFIDPNDPPTGQQTCSSWR